MQLLAEARCGRDGKLTLPHRLLIKTFKIGNATAADVRKMLLGLDMLVEIEPPLRPGRMGSASRSGRAAVYRLVHRVQGSTIADLRWHRGEVRPVDGYWRVNSQFLRHWLSIFTVEAIAILAHLHAAPHNYGGALVCNYPRPVRLHEVGGLKRTTFHAAMRELVEKGALQEVEPQRGQRPARYRLTSAFIGGDVGMALTPAGARSK